MKRTFLQLCLLLLACMAYAQKNEPQISVNGIVMDRDLAEPMEQATVKLLSLPDSALITGTVSGNGGVFDFTTSYTGKALLAVSFVGFDTSYKPLSLSGSASKVTVGEIYLFPSSLLLGEAVVEGKAPEIVVKLDTSEYTASAYKLQQNAMLEELLKKLSGVEVDSDGNITVAGKAINKILVDGKEFFGTDTKIGRASCRERVSWPV